jgi:hypothetical protein
MVCEFDLLAAYNQPPNEKQRRSSHGAWSGQLAAWFNTKPNWLLHHLMNAFVHRSLYNAIFKKSREVFRIRRSALYGLFLNDMNPTASTPFFAAICGKIVRPQCRDNIFTQKFHFGKGTFDKILRQIIAKPRHVAFAFAAFGKNRSECKKITITTHCYWWILTKFCRMTKKQSNTAKCNQFVTERKYTILQTKKRRVYVQQRRGFYSETENG